MYQHAKNTSKLRTGLISCSLFAFLTFTANLNAAESESSTQNNNEIEEVVVTGTRLRLNNANSAVPLQVLNKDDIVEIGSTDLQEVLTDIPGIEIGVSDQNSTNGIQRNGISSISLRRLGDDRTLTLINGKRSVGNSGNSNRLDVSTIPVGFIARTEVTTGGASAVYGSDAIGGVVNVLLEDDYVGQEVEARYSTPQASGRDERTLNLRSGQTYAGDKGYLLFAGSYLDRGQLSADSSRPETLLPIEFDDPSTSFSNSFADEINQPGCDPANEDRHCFLGSFSTSTPGGVFEGGDAWFRDGQWFNDQSLQLSDRTGSQDFYNDFDGYNFREDVGLLAETQRFNIGAHTEYEFSSSLLGKLTFIYADNSTVTQRGYETLNDDDEFGANDEFEIGDISASHPFIPPEVEETRNGSVSFDRRLIELGQQARSNERQTYRLFGDLSGEFSNGFDWEAYASYGRFNQEQTTLNEYNQRRAQDALNVEVLPDGSVQCERAEARAEGCVPLNIFGEGSISEAAADYIRYNAFGTNQLTQHSVGGYVTGDIYDLPAGPVKAVFGLEHRRDLQTTVGDRDGDLIGGIDGDPNTVDVDETSAATFPDLKAEGEVIEAYFETELPIIADKLAVQIAGRLADYDTVGNVSSWNFGGYWAPTDSVKIRGQISRAQRAPNLTELYSDLRPDSDDLLDPCEGILPGADGTVNVGDSVPNADVAVIRANCLSQAGIQAYFADPENIDPDTGLLDAFDAPGSVQGPNGGNPNVLEETADTFTIGAVLQPSFAENLTVTLDYFQIDIEDAIGSISTQDVVDQCYASADFPNNRFCDAIIRRTSDGEITQVINRQENLNSETVEGFDVNLDYSFELNKLFSRLPGEFDVDLRYTKYLTDEEVFSSVDGSDIISTDLGTLGDPDERYRLRLGYDLNDLRVTWTARYIPGGIDDPINDGLPSDDRFFEVGGVVFHRLYASYDFGNDDQYRISAGIDNLFDKAGPLVPSGLDNGSSSNINSVVNDLIGREYFVQLRARF